MILPTKTENSSVKIGKVVFANNAAAESLSAFPEQLCRPEQYNWQVIKHSDTRTVYRGSIDGQKIYLKHYHDKSFWHRLGRFFGISNARREMRFIKFLDKCSVPTAPALAAMCDNGIEWLATAAVDPAEQADKWHISQLNSGSRRQIQQAIIELAKLIGKLHAAGVIHKDLHCGNVLVRGHETLTPQPAPSLVLMDLHRASRRRKLSRRAMAANLAQLYHDRMDFTTRTERLRFLKHYLQTTGCSGTLRGWQQLIEHFAARHTRRQYEKRDSRILGNNRYFARIKLPNGWRGHVVLASKRQMAGSQAAEFEFSLQEWKELLQCPESLFTGRDVQMMKDSPSGMAIRRKIEIGGHKLDVVIKRPRRKKRWKILLDCFRAARPIRAFRLGHQLLTRRIATALPVVAIQRRIGPVLLDSLLITEAVDAPNLGDFLQTWLSLPPKGDALLTAARQRQLGQEVLWQLGRMLQRLHDNNFAHRDLKATNMLIRWSTETSPDVVLVDLDGLKRIWFMTERRRFQGLMRMNVSLLQCPVVNHAGRLRMLLGYLRRAGSGKINFKPYWRVLENWSARKLERQIRSRRKKQRKLRG